jgi:hypothetical protein
VIINGRRKWFSDEVTDVLLGAERDRLSARCLARKGKAPAHFGASKRPPRQGLAALSGGARRARLWARDKLRTEHVMYRVLAYGFVVFTALLVLVLLVFWWQESREAARRRRIARPKI